MITLPVGVTMADVRNASDSVSAQTLESSPFAQRVTAALDLYGRALKAIDREGRGKITSILRSVERNASLPGASRHSHHLTGYAVDFVIPGVSTTVVFDALKGLHTQLRFDELAVYDGHVHLSADPRARGKIIDKRTKGRKGTTLPSTIAVLFGLLLALLLTGALYD